MKNKMQADFEDFKARYAGGFLNDAADDTDKLLHTVARDAWQAATLAERERCALVCEREKQVSIASAKWAGVRTDQRDYDICIAAIRRGVMYD